MSSRFDSFWKGLRYCGDCAALLLCWVLWLALGAALALQVAVVVSKEFAVPAFALRAIEERLGEAGVGVRFGRATCDARGELLLENLKLSLPEFPDPVVTVRAVYIELDPWQLLAGRVEPRRLRATGVTVFVPAMLAPTGRNEEALRELDFALAPDGSALVIEHCHGRIADLVVALRGRLQLPASPDRRDTGALALVEKFARRYAEFSRQVVRIREQLAVLGEPRLEAVIEPAATRGATVHATLTASSLALPRFGSVQATALRASARVPLVDATTIASSVRLSVDEIRAADLHARGFQAQLSGSVNLTPFDFAPRSLRFAAREIAGRGFSVDSASAHVRLHLLPVVSGRLIAQSLGGPLNVEGGADLVHKTATAHLDARLSPDLLEPISELARRDLRRFVNFGQPVDVDAQATFAEGWKFDRLKGHVRAREIDAYRVPMDLVQGSVEFDGRRFLAHHTMARLGDNVARGSFEQDFATREFRFLLEGRLRPLDIGGWFKPWWAGFFERFEFPHAPPDANVDVSGRWRAPRETTVFVFAESQGPSIRGAEFDYARTRLFIRPNFFDGLELYGTRGIGDIRGEFVRTIDVDQRLWKEFTFRFTSSIDLEAGASLLGPALGPRLQPYVFAQPPRLKVSGRFAGPAAPEGEHQQLEIAAQSDGPVSVFRYPGRNLSFDATLRDDDLVLENVSADVAQGTVTGRARIWGRGEDRRAGFDAVLRNASLGELVATTSAFLAERRGGPEPAVDRVLSGRNAARIDLALSAEGRAGDPLSYFGSGNATVVGQELGEVRLLGLLSELLNFTALRFTHAQGDFKVDGPIVTFRSVNVTGSNSAIHAHGHYSLEQQQLDFNARVYPFQESSSILQNVMGLMLTPLSAVLEVRLTGALHEPKWAFVIGPTNLLRSLAQPADIPESPPATPAEARQP